MDKGKKKNQKIKIIYDKDYNEYLIVEGEYQETEQQAEPTGRVLDGSRDHGYWMEYVGLGTVGKYPVRAVYLLDEDQSDIEDAGNYDWDTALKNGRIVIDVDRLSQEDYDALAATYRN